MAEKEYKPKPTEPSATSEQLSADSEVSPTAETEPKHRTEVDRFLIDSWGDISAENEAELTEQQRFTQGQQTVAKFATRATKITKVLSPVSQATTVHTQEEAAEASRKENLIFYGLHQIGRVLQNTFSRGSDGVEEAVNQVTDEGVFKDSFTKESKEAVKNIFHRLQKNMGLLYRLNNPDATEEGIKRSLSKLRFHAATNMLLPLALLNRAMESLPMSQTFQRIVELFWLHRVGRFCDRSGKLLPNSEGKRPQPRDVSLQAEQSSHPSYVTHSLEARENLQNLPLAEQMALRIVASLKWYSEGDNPERYLLLEPKTLRIGFRSRGRFFRLEMDQSEVLDRTKHDLSGFVRELARVLEEMKKEESEIESISLLLGLQRTLQAAAYNGRHSFDAATELFYDADFIFVLDELQDEPDAVQKFRKDPASCTGGSATREVTAFVTKDGALTSDLTFFAHTWFVGLDGFTSREEQDAYLAEYARRYSEEASDASTAQKIPRAKLRTRVEGVSFMKLAGEIKELPREKQKQWLRYTNILASSMSPDEIDRWYQLCRAVGLGPRDFAPGAEGAVLPHEFLARHEVAGERLLGWDARLSALRQAKYPVKATVSDLTNLAVQLVRGLPESMHGVMAKKVAIEAPNGKQVELDALEILHVVVLGNLFFEQYPDFAEQLEAGELESDSDLPIQLRMQRNKMREQLAERLELYRLLKDRARDDKEGSLAAFMQALSGNFEKMIEGTSRAAISDEDVDTVKGGAAGLQSHLHIPRFLDPSGQGVHMRFFGTALADSYFPRSAAQQDDPKSKFSGGIGVDVTGQWRTITDEQGQEHTVFEETGLQFTQRLSASMRKHLMQQSLDEYFDEMERYYRTPQGQRDVNTAEKFRPFWFIGSQEVQVTQIPQWKRIVRGAIEQSLSVENYNPKKLTEILSSSFTPTAINALVSTMEQAVVTESEEFLKHIADATDFLLYILDGRLPLSEQETQQVKKQKRLQQRIMALSDAEMSELAKNNENPRALRKEYLTAYQTAVTGRFQSYHDDANGRIGREFTTTLRQARVDENTIVALEEKLGTLAALVADEA